ncbi:hypothetical protein YC2023_076562 [Brassica napus]
MIVYIDRLTSSVPLGVEGTRAALLCDRGRRSSREKTTFTKMDFSLEERKLAVFVAGFSSTLLPDVRASDSGLRFVSSLMAELRRSSSLIPAKEVIARLDACPENAGRSCTWWVTCSLFPSQRFAFIELTTR